MKEFIIIIGIFILLSIAFNMVMRKWLKVKKKESFSYNHVNEKHKKIDWTIRISFLLILLVSYFYNVIGSFKGNPLIIEFWVLAIIYLVISEIVRAIMERKYLPNQKDYILTISNLVLSILFLLIAIRVWG